MSQYDFLICGRCSGPIDAGKRRCPYCGASAVDANQPFDAVDAIERQPGESLLMAPPRPVPPSLKVSALFGGFANVFGWMFGGFGLIFVIIFGGSADVGALFSWAYTQPDRAVVVDSQPTSWTVGGSRNSSGARMHANTYEYRTPDGETRRGEAYTRGQPLEIGRQIEIGYSSARPGASRPTGYQAAPLPLWGLFVALFPAIGAGFIYAGLKRGRKAIRLLAEGLLTKGLLIEKKATNTRYNNRTVYRLTFTFPDESGELHEVTTRTHEPEKLEDDEEEPIVYDPHDPSRATTVDDLPGSVRIGPDGHFVVAHPRAAYAKLLLPAIACLGALIAAIVMAT